MPRRFSSKFYLCLHLRSKTYLKFRCPKHLMTALIHPNRQPHRSRCQQHCFRLIHPNLNLSIQYPFVVVNPSNQESSTIHVQLHKALKNLKTTGKISEWSQNSNKLYGCIRVFPYWLCTETLLTSSDQRKHYSPTPIYRGLVLKRLTEHRA